MRKPTSVPASSSFQWLFVLTLAGYPIAALLASALNWDSTLTSIPFRASLLLLAVWAVARLPSRQTVSTPVRWLFLFWIVYFSRLVWDWLIAGVPGSSEAIVYYPLIVLIPCIALVLRSQAWADAESTVLVAWIGAGICAAAVLMYAFDVGTERSLTEQTQRLSFEAVNPITLGHAGTTTLIAILCLTQRRLSPLAWLALPPAALAAGACLVLAASRGPMVALGVVALAFVLATGRWRWLVGMALLLLPLLDQDSALWTRVASTEEDQSTILRLLFQGNAIVQFLNHPWLGSAFVELESLTYPHNLFIETAMALGVLGTGILLVVLLKCMVTATQLARRGKLLLPLLFLQYFIGIQLSGAIYSSGAFWATVALLVGIPLTAKKSRRVNRQAMHQARQSSLKVKSV